ncbi:TadE/TadG family type IV pilus assembly protein [Streptomyces sp. NPDC059828]|uniref:TadE/TadG family type IV pilus assembly protein n=1 Tax=Streptomyces sp. NPDC059828 TaxID=3346965 RepID=UPI00364F805F
MRVLSAPRDVHLAGDGRDSRRGRDRGQIAVEFLGMFPLIAIVCVLLWQCALLGYTYILAGNAADEAARAGAVAEFAADAKCQSAAREDLGSWRQGATVACGGVRSDGLYTASVRLKVPVLFPGTVSFPLTAEGEAAFVKEG